MEIRFVRATDYQQLLNIYQPYVLKTPISFETTVPSIEEFSQRIENIQKKYPYFVAVKNNQVIGYAYASSYRSRAAFDSSVELSIYVDQNHHHGGIGKQLYQILLDSLKDLGFVMAYACITYPNEKSVAFHQKFGFDLIGHFHKSGFKFNQFHDTLFMELQLQENIHQIKSLEQLKKEYQ